MGVARLLSPVDSGKSGKRGRARILPLASPYREQGYGVFKVDDWEFISARTPEEAINWFLDNWIVNTDELYKEPIELSLDEEIFHISDSESDIFSITFRQLIKEAINDKTKFPCIIATKDWQ